MKKAIIWGASGHAKVLYPILKKQGFSVVAMIDRNNAVRSFIPNCPVFPSDKELPFSVEDDISFAIAIGGDRGHDRMQIHDSLSARGFKPITLIHSAAWVAETVKLADGAQVLGMAAVSEEAHIGMHSIINTNASVDHECVINNGCHVMPGATLAGCVEVGDFATIGSNATIFPRIKIGTGAVIGAGAVVTRDVLDYAVVIGNPAKLLKTNLKFEAVREAIIADSTFGPRPELD